MYVLVIFGIEDLGITKRGFAKRFCLPPGANGHDRECENGE